MKTKKILIRWFVDFDKEEKFLNEQSKAGWDFWHTNGVIYRFHACEPGEFIYQIDFDEKKSAIGEDYVVFRNSCGDTFVHQWKDKIYWKKSPRTDLSKQKTTPSPSCNWPTRLSISTWEASLAWVSLSPSPSLSFTRSDFSCLKMDSRCGWLISVQGLLMVYFFSRRSSCFCPGQVAPENEWSHQTTILKSPLSWRFTLTSWPGDRLPDAGY